MGFLFVFDYDGTLADTLDTYRAGLLGALECESVAWRPAAAEFLDLFDGNLFEALQDAGVAPECLARVLARLPALLAETEGSVRLFAGVADALRRLADQHVLAVVTSNSARSVERVLARESVLGCFACVLGYEAGHSKIGKIERVRGVCPEAEACFYIGDTVGDMLEGRRAGAIPVGVSWGWHPPERLARGEPVFTAASPTDWLLLPDRHGAGFTGPA